MTQTINHSLPSFSPPIALLVFLLTINLTRAHDFNCYNIFRQDYAVFVMANPKLMYTETPMQMWNGSGLVQGTLYHNYCFDFELDGFCGVDKVRGRSIFVKSNPSITESKCLLLEPAEEQTWEFTNFKSDANIIKLPGVQAVNRAFKIYELGANGINLNIVKDVVNHYENEMDNQLLQGANQMNNMMNNFGINAKIQVDSSNHPKYRVLGRNQGQNLTPNDSQTIAKLNVPQTNHFKEEQDLALNMKMRSEIEQNIQDKIMNGTRHPQLLKGNNTDLKQDEVAEREHVGREVGSVTSKITFFCDSAKDQMDVHFLPNQKLFEINVYSKDGCVVNLEFLQILNQYPIVTGIIFALIGIGLAFLGIKIYKNMLYVFIPLVLALLGFFLYFAFVEAAGTTTNKIISLAILLAVFIGLIITIVWCNWVIFAVISFLAAFQLGTLLKGVLEAHMALFTHPYTEWIIIIVLFIGFLIFYFMAEEYFLIITTALTGSLFIVMALKFLSVTTYDFLFDTQMDRWNNFTELDPEAQKMTIVFLGVALLGTLLQVILYCRDMKKEKEVEKLAVAHDHCGQYDPDHLRGVQLNGI